MSIVAKACGSLRRRFVERQARGRSWSELAQNLADSGDDLSKRMHEAPDTWPSAGG